VALQALCQEPVLIGEVPACCLLSCLGLLALVERLAKRRDAAGQARVMDHA